MEQSSPTPRAETGSTSPQEQAAVKSLALDIQEVSNTYKQQSAEGRDGTNIPLMFLAGDINKLKELGVLDKYKGALEKFGADPIIRFAILSQIIQLDQVLESVADKSPFLANIRMPLELGEALGMGESAGNPDFEAAAGLFNSFREKYQGTEEPDEQPVPAAETPQKEPTPEEVSSLVAQLREAKEHKEEDDYGERVGKRDMAKELERELGEVLNLPPEAGFEALDKSTKDNERAFNLSQAMIYFILDSPYDREKIPSIESLLSQISPEVLESYKLYVQARERSRENQDSDTDLRKETADELNKQQNSLITKLKETAGDESGEIWATDTFNPNRQWENTIQEENPDIDELRRTLTNRNQALIANHQEYTSEFQKLIDLFNNAAAKAGLEFMEGESGYLELVEKEMPAQAVKPAQSPKGPGVLGRLTGLFRKGEPGPEMQAKQIIGDLEEADDETILHNYSLMEKLDNLVFKEILEKGVELAPQFKNGLKPGNLGELTKFSEDVTKKMEEKGILDPEEHGDNIKNIRLTLWHIMQVELSGETAPRNIKSAQDLIKFTNSFLEGRAIKTDNKRLTVNPDLLGTYLKEIIPFPQGAGFDGIPQVTIEKQGKENIMVVKGKISTSMDLGGNVSFSLSFGNNRGGGIELTDAGFDFSEKMKEREEEVRSRLGEIINTIKAQTNSRIDKRWEVAGFSIANEGVVFDFRKKPA